MDEEIKNLKRCSCFDTCNQNLCPLDFELTLRGGNASNKCRWMRGPKATKIMNKEFVSGGQVMPNAILNFVPEGNLKWLNEASQKRWKSLRDTLYQK